MAAAPSSIDPRPGEPDDPTDPNGSNHQDDLDDVDDLGTLGGSGGPSAPADQRDDPARRARQLWKLLEPVHALQYFAPDARAHFEDVGLKGFWMGYFASRAAALGPVGPEVVEATFYVFNPIMVSRAIPDAWRFSSPEAVLEARATLADAGLRAALGDLVDSDEVRIAADVAVTVARTAPRAGRPLGAAHAGLPVPPLEDPLGQLWWAATVLREHRGDGHVAALVSAGVDPCAALVLAAAGGAAGPQGAALLQTARQWSDADWSAATRRLAARGWLDDHGALTPAGEAARQSIEDTTDSAAAVAYAPFGPADLDPLVDALRPLTTQIVASGALPFPNPIGLDPSTELGPSPVPESSAGQRSGPADVADGEDGPADDDQQGG